VLPDSAKCVLAGIADLVEGNETIIDDARECLQLLVDSGAITSSRCQATTVPWEDTGLHIVAARALADSNIIEAKEDELGSLQLALVPSDVQ